MTHTSHSSEFCCSVILHTADMSCKALQCYERSLNAFAVALEAAWCRCWNSGGSVYEMCYASLTKGVVGPVSKLPLMRKKRDMTQVTDCTHLACLQRPRHASSSHVGMQLSALLTIKVFEVWIYCVTSATYPGWP